MKALPRGWTTTGTPLWLVPALLLLAAWGCSALGTLNRGYTLDLDTEPRLVCIFFFFFHLHPCIPARAHGRGMEISLSLSLSLSPGCPAASHKWRVCVCGLQRWKAIVRDVLARTEWNETYGSLARKIDATYRSVGCTAACRAELEALFRAQYPDQFRELVFVLSHLQVTRKHTQKHQCTNNTHNRGIAEVFAERGHSEVDVRELAAWQYYYEVAHVARGAGPVPDAFGCTSALAVDARGTVHHGRNLDIPAADDYRRTAAHVAWRRGGRALFATAQNVAENVGVATGVAAAAGLSFSYNWRRDAADAAVASLPALLRCLRGNSTAAAAAAAAPLASFVRTLFEDAVPGERAAALLAARRLCAPAYIAVGTPSAGIVLTRNSTHSLHPRRVARGTAAWHVSQANYDHYRAQPPADDRLGLAEAAFDTLGRTAGASRRGVWRVLSVRGNGVSRGVLNSDTVYSAYMRPGDGTMEDVLRDSADAAALD